jgi:serine/threonine-protein kinase
VALMRLIAPVTALSMIAIWVPRDVGGRLLCSAIFGTTLVVTIWLMVRFRDPTRFDPRLAVAQGLLCVVSIVAAATYVGGFSPVIMAACIGIYFFGQSDSLGAGWLIYIACALGFFGLHAATLAGFVSHEQAVVSIANPDVRGLAALGVMMQVMLALTFWMARRTRRATRDAFDRLDRAARQIRQREALLNEARAELDQAQGAKVGRYSGRAVGPYLVDEVIGRGAMGEVYEARNLVTNQLVALKFLHAMVLEEPQAVQRFFREAQVAATLASPHIVRVIEMGNGDDGAPFIAMELLRGDDLAHFLREKKRLSVSAVVELVTQVAQALAVADEAGIVHRDIKPQNLFLADEGKKRLWKVLDFGVSKMRETAGTITHGAAVGTPSYMSPEQAMARDVDHRADVFALGVIAYRALTGRPAFTGPDSVATLYNVVHVQPARPGDFVALDPDVDRALALVLAKRPDRRFSTATMFAAALRDAVSGRLDQRLRDAADALISEEPWGLEIRSR